MRSGESQGRRRTFAHRPPLTTPRAARVRLVLLALLLAVGAALTFVGAAAAAPVTIVDDRGPDDVPGQKDLNFLTVDYGLPGATTINVQWGWDDTATSGANTRDGCALFDSDHDGKANFGFCFTVNSNGTFTAQVLRCGNTDPDRCGGGVPVPGAVSTGSVSTPPNSDPFGGKPGHSQCSGPNCLRDDTIANANVVLSDVGGAGTRLVNVCSYPSGPGSAPSDCVVTAGSGFLTIVKVANPNDGTAFVFNASKASTDNRAQFTINGSGSVMLIPYAPGTFNLNEVLPPNWQLGAHACVLGNSATGTPTGTPTATGVDNVTIQSGIETVCTYTDSLAPGTLTLVKAVNNLGESGPGFLGPGDFPLTINGTPTTTGTPVSVAAGTQTIAETSRAGYAVGAWTCTNGDTGAAGSVSARA